VLQHNTIICKRLETLHFVSAS